MLNINQTQLKKVLGKVAMLMAVVTLFVFGLKYDNTSAAITKEISYQGKLTNTSNVAVADGNYNMVISIYDAASGGNCLWTARGTCGTPTARSVAVANGIFSIMLGETGDNAINLDFNSTYYLGIKVGADTEMSPRKKVGASGYAFNSDRLDGYDESAFVMLNGRSAGQTLIGGTAPNSMLVLQGNSSSGNTATNASIQMKVGNSGGTTAVTILNNGNVGIGATNPTALLSAGATSQFQVNSSGAIAAATGVTSSGTITFTGLGTGTDNTVVILNASNQLTTDEIDARVWGTSLVDGAGTQNYVARWSDSNTLTTGVLFDNGTNVGIGTTNPAHKLDVVGNLRFGLGQGGGNTRGYLGGTWTTAEGYKFATLGSTYFNGANWITNEGTYFGSNNVSTLASDTSGIKFYTQSSTGNTTRTDTTATFNTYERMRIDMSGNVGIGTTNPGTYRLNVSGNTFLNGTTYFGNTAYNITNTGVATLNTNETINGIDINAGAISDITTIGSTYLNTGASYVDLVGSAELRVGGTATITSGRLFRAADGAVGTPAYSFGTDTNTGIYRGAEDILRFATGGADRMTIYSNGSVGVGTTAPGYLLDVSGSANNYLSRIYNTNTGASAGGLFVRSEGTGNLLTLNYAGSDMMTVSPAQTTINNPVAMTSAGDVSIYYDLYFNNSTASYIKFQGPGYIQTESPIGDLDLTLSAANNGQVIVNDTLKSS